MPIVIFCAIVSLILTFIVIYVHYEQLQEDKALKSMAKENSALDIQEDHERLCFEVKE